MKRRLGKVGHRIAHHVSAVLLEYERQVQRAGPEAKKKSACPSEYGLAVAEFWRCRVAASVRTRRHVARMPVESVGLVKMILVSRCWLRAMARCELGLLLRWCGLPVSVTWRRVTGVMNEYTMHLSSGGR